MSLPNWASNLKRTTTTTTKPRLLLSFPVLTVSSEVGKAYHISALIFLVPDGVSKYRGKSKLKTLFLKCSFC